MRFKLGNAGSLRSTRASQSKKQAASERAMFQELWGHKSEESQVREALWNLRPLDPPEGSVKHGSIADLRAPPTHLESLVLVLHLH